MSEPELLSTELMLKELMRETDKAVAKAQAAMTKVVGKPAEPEAAPKPQAAASEGEGINEVMTPVGNNSGRTE